MFKKLVTNKDDYLKGVCDEFLSAHRDKPFAYNETNIGLKFPNAAFAFKFFCDNYNRWTDFATLALYYNSEKVLRRAAIAETGRYWIDRLRYKNGIMAVRRPAERILFLCWLCEVPDYLTEEIIMKYGREQEDTTEDEDYISEEIVISYGRDKKETTDDWLRKQKAKTETTDDWLNKQKARNP